MISYQYQITVRIKLWFLHRNVQYYFYSQLLEKPENL